MQGATPRDADFRQRLCADIDGFSLHAAVRCVADERVQTNAAGQVVLKLKAPWVDGTIHLVMSPLESMQRRAERVRTFAAPAARLGFRRDAPPAAFDRPIQRSECQQTVDCRPT